MHEMLPVSTPPQHDAEGGSPWRSEAALNESRDARIHALIEAARGPRFMGMDKKQLAWLVIHTFCFSVLCALDTHFTVRLHGALDRRHGTGGDRLYMLGALAALVTTGLLYQKVYASDPGWVRPGSKAEAPDRPMCQYCGVRPPLRSRHCFLTGQCVVKYDHFCDLLSTPVGDLNHRGFWTFILMQTFTAFWGVSVAGSAIAECFSPSTLRGGGTCWNLTPVRSTVLVLVFMFLLALGLLFLSLFALHTYLLCSGQSTYELLKGISVPYLSTFYAMYTGPHSRQVRYNSVWPELLRRWIIGNPPPAPFSEGLARNAEIFFFAEKPYNYQYRSMAF